MKRYLVVDPEKLGVRRLPQLCPSLLKQGHNYKMSRQLFMGDSDQALCFPTPVRLEYLENETEDLGNDDWL